MIILREASDGENKCDDDGLVLKQVRTFLRRLTLNLSRGYATFSLFYTKLLSDHKTTATKIISNYMLSST